MTDAPPPSTTASVSTAVNVRRATSNDAATVAAMVKEIAVHESQATHVHVDEAQWRMLLIRPEVIVLLAEIDAAAVGYVSVVRQLHLWTGGDILALDDLYVRPGHRDLGVGRRLMSALAAIGAPERLLIRWGVELDNVDAQRFYRRLDASLRHKVVVTWRPSAYTKMPGVESGPEAPESCTADAS